MRVLGVILARGGSKTIPLKNIAECGGKPLIYWTVKAAMESGVIDHLVVSTDHFGIAEMVRRYPDVEIVWRPEELAGDEVPSFDALKWTVEEAETWYMAHQKFDIIAELPTTNPLKTGDDVRGAVELLKSSSPDVDSVASVSLVVNHPSRAKCLDEISGDLFLSVYCSSCGEHDNRKQDFFEPAYERNGAVYVMRRETLFQKKDRFGEKCVPYIMIQEKSVNIDTPFDLKVADLILKQREK